MIGYGKAEIKSSVDVKGIDACANIVDRVSVSHSGIRVASRCPDFVLVQVSVALAQVSRGHHP
jgi:hypothetical protein